MRLQSYLDALFTARRASLAAEAQFRNQGRVNEGDLVETLKAAIGSAVQTEPQAERAMRLQTLARLCTQTPRRELVDALINALDVADSVTRSAIGDALVHIGFDRPADVGRAVDDALDRGRTGAGMADLAWVVGEIGEPSALKQLRRFLESTDSEVVASAVDALVALGDPAAIEALESLLADERRISTEVHPAAEVTLAVLAADAIHELNDADVP